MRRKLIIAGASLGVLLAALDEEALGAVAPARFNSAAFEVRQGSDR